MIYRLISIDEVLAGIFRNIGLNLSNEEIPINDFIEWCGEALRHIGAYPQFKDRSDKIDIVDYKGKLPCDFYEMISIKGGTCYNNDQNYNSNLIADECNVNDLQTRINELPYVGPRSYSINFDTITTNYRNGTMLILYKAFPVDEKGFPLVPDSQSYKDALFWKVVYQLAIRGYEFKNPQMRDINFSRAKWNFYCLQAGANAEMPTTQQANKLARNWTSFAMNRIGVTGWNY